MMKTVEPYISIVSPAPRTPTLSASAAASMVPKVTGVPGASPVSPPPRSVTCPAISADQPSRGSMSSGDDVRRELRASNPARSTS